MSVRVRDVSGGGSAAAQGGAEARLASLVSEALKGSAESREYWVKEDEELGVRVDAYVERGVGGSYVYRQVYVSFLDSYVDESGVLVERAVANVGAAVELFSFHVEYSSERLPSTWRPPQHLALLPAALNTTLSALGAGKILSERLGFAVGGASVRYMFDAYDAKRRPVILLSAKIGGNTYTFNELKVDFLYSAARITDLHLGYSVLLRHGDRRFAKRLYVLAWLGKELEKALERFCVERGCKVEGGGLYRVWLKGEVVKFPNPRLDGEVNYFDEEYLALKQTSPRLTLEGHEPILVLEGRRLHLSEALEYEHKRSLERVKSRSKNKLRDLVKTANRLMDSKDPRLKDLGFLLAVLIIRAYEEAEMAIPG